MVQDTLVESGGNVANLWVVLFSRASLNRDMTPKGTESASASIAGPWDCKIYSSPTEKVCQLKTDSYNVCLMVIAYCSIFVQYIHLCF